MQVEFSIIVDRKQVHESDPNMTSYGVIQEQKLNQKTNAKCN